MKKILVTGCAGFIGCQVVKRFLDKGFKVTGIDDLSRRGSKANLAWLRGMGGKFFFHQVDVRSFSKVSAVFKAEGPFDLIIHAAGQVAVTTSVIDPRRDFEINAGGALNVLEAVRLFSPEAFLQYSSTNKVYGEMKDVAVVLRRGRYEYKTLSRGISEKNPLDFHSPYGCSKGAADQYVHDYSRIYGLKTVVLRQSCIYGTRQFGIEDQGWISWFTIASLMGRRVTIYGDGKQSRDVLWIDDLVDAYEALYEHQDKAAGKVFNVGGGPKNVLSLLELVSHLKAAKIMKEQPCFAGWRAGDQKVFVSDVSCITRATGWRPKVTPQEGLDRIIDWSSQHMPEIKKWFR